MIVIWSRLGVVALIVPMAVIVPTLAVIASLNHPTNESLLRTWHYGFTAGCFVSAVALWFVGRWLNKPRQKTVTDPTTGEQVVVPTGGGLDTLFFIPVEYWSFLWVVIGLISVTQFFK